MKEYCLGEVVTLFDSLHKTPKSYSDDGYPMIRVTDVNRGFVSLEGTKKVPKDVFEEFSKKHKPTKGDIIFTRVGSYGNSCFVDKDNDFCLGQNTVCITPNTEILSPYYLYSFLNSFTAKAQIDSFISGSSQPTISLKSIKEIKVPIPSLKIQETISNAIFNYDNLIENNSHRIAILEDITQSLYREWFVNFRYPGHADAVDASLDEKQGNQKLIDSPLGQIPEGWEVKTAAEAITINPKTKLVKDGEKPFVGMKGLSEGSMVIGDIIEKTGNSGAKFINGDTLFARITPCLQNGKTGYVLFLNPEQPVGFGSTEFIVLRERDDLSSEFIYLLSRSNNFREHAIQSMTGATGRQRVHNDCFASYYLPVPPKELMNEFTKIVKPMFKSIFNLSRRNENLKKQRDMLLPKLISGKIEL
ncbi:type I restriction endonuclease subunit S [Thalassotalea sp. 42_200_T64]|nr:type I restriction endonuclease subunit S [Thalassotalea sp. 42_200_T64]